MVLLCLCCELDAKKVAASFDRSALKYKLLPERNTKYETIPFPNSILISMNEWEKVFYFSCSFLLETIAAYRIIVIGKVGV